MNYNDILALARAGFTAQQIAALQQLAPAAPAPAAPAPAADPNGAKLDTLIALFQQQQLSAQQPRTMTADKILADIIAPQPPKTDDK